MTYDIDSLPNDPQALKQLLAQLQAELLKEQQRSAYLEEKFRIAQQKQFGKSAEGHPGQGELFNEAESLQDAEPEVDAEKAPISNQRKKSKPKRQSLPKDLPREVIVHDISDDEKVCGCCGGELHQIGEDKSEQLEFIPAQVKVIEHVRPKYGCRHCESNATTVTIKQAPVPASPIPKSMATPSLLSQVITNKYHYGLPLYRQESMFKQHGIALNRKTMASWMLRCSELLIPLYDTLHQYLLKQHVLQADETPLQVIKEDKAKCYMWLYCSGTDSPADHTMLNIVLYDYQPSRAGACPVNYLADYQGYLQVDGYAAYEQTQATLAGCWAHVRRKFKEAADALPKNKKGKGGKAHWALSHIQKLYAIEQRIKTKTTAEKQQIRQQQAKPLLAQFKVWLDKSLHQVPPKTSLGKALSYCLNQWSKLVVYLEHGDITIDNNRAERAIKPFVIGRKNWLFANTARGANASAILYSLIETAKANGLTPFDYLHHVLKTLPERTKDDSLEDLLPWNVSLS